MTLYIFCAANFIASKCFQVHISYCSNQLIDVAAIDLQVTLHLCALAFTLLGSLNTYQFGSGHYQGYPFHGLAVWATSGYRHSDASFCSSGVKITYLRIKVLIFIFAGIISQEAGNSYSDI